MKLRKTSKSYTIYIHILCVYALEGIPERERERENYRIESTVLLEAFFKKSRLRFCEPKFLPSIQSIVVFIASSGGNPLYLNLLAANLSLSLHTYVGERGGGAVLSVEVSGMVIIQAAFVIVVGIRLFNEMVGFARQAEG